MGFGGKLGIDATRKLPEEKQLQVQTQRNEQLPEITYLLNNIPNILKIKVFELAPFRFVLLISASETNVSLQQLKEQIVRSLSINNVDVIILTDSFISLDDFESLIWYCLNNTDPGRDCTIINEISLNHPILFIDAQRKIKDEKRFQRNGQM